MNIITTPARITRVTDLSPTAREVALVPETPLGFEAGAFVNVFVTVDGEERRRAFSFSSDPNEQGELTLTVRLIPDGAVSPFFWREDAVGSTVKLMGPLGKNTADKLTQPKAVLVAFGVGVSVIKAVAHRILARPDLASLTIITGNRSESEILYRTFFEELASRDERVTFRPVVAQSSDAATSMRVGMVPDHLDDVDFTHADVYVCGMKPACEALVDTVRRTGAEGTAFFIEAF